MKHTRGLPEDSLRRKLQHAAAQCYTLQHTLQYTATHLNTKHRTATGRKFPEDGPSWRAAEQCNTLQHTATHCNILQSTRGFLKNGPFRFDIRWECALYLLRSQIHHTQATRHEQTKTETRTEIYLHTNACAHTHRTQTKTETETEIYSNTNACAHTYTHIHAHTYTHKKNQVHIHQNMSFSVFWMYVCMYVCKYASMYVCMYVCMYMCM